MTPKHIVDAIESRLGVTGKPSQVRDTIELALLEKFRLTAAEAAEKSDRLHGNVILVSVHKVHAGTQYLVSLRNMSLIEARRTKARAIRLRFS